MVMVALSGGGAHAAAAAASASARGGCRNGGWVNATAEFLDWSSYMLCVKLVFSPYSCYYKIE